MKGLYGTMQGSVRCTASWQACLLPCLALQLSSTSQMVWGHIRPTLDLRQAYLACIGPSLQGEGDRQMQAAC